MIEGIVISSVIAVLAVYIYRHYNRKYLKLCMPKKVSMDTDAFPAFVKILRKVMDSHCRQVMLDFSKVTQLDYESYLVLLALVEKALYKNKKLMLSNIPQIDQVQAIFFDYNKNRTVYHQSNPFPLLNADFYFKNDKITPEVTYRIENELKKIDIRDYYEFNTMVSELVGNAIEHGILHHTINWWMYHCKDYKTRAIKFVFVDMGIGIVDSYRKAGLSPEYQKKTDADILLLALNGVLGSSTKEPNRGRGLPQIKDMVEKSFISDFVLITNSVSLRYNNGQFEQFRHQNFVGTYYSWTISKENFLSWRDRI